MAYVTLADLKAYLKINSASDDALLNSFLAAAQAFIEGPAGAGRRFEARETATARIIDAADAGDGAVLYLDDDLAAVESITDDGAAVEDWTTHPRNEAPYFALKNVSGSWGGAVEITGQWVYSLTPPADIAHACKRLAAWMYRQRDSSADVDRATVTGDGTTILPSAVPRDVLDICSKYRRYV